MTILQFKLIQQVVPDLLSTSRIAEAVGDDKGNVSSVLNGRRELPILRKKIIEYACEVMRKNLFDERFAQSIIEAKRSRAAR